MKSWIEYWDGDHPIYVNARHMSLHYRFLARDFAALILDQEANVLDYGCGEALSADLVAESCKKLILSDAAPTIRAKLATRFANNRRILVASLEDVAAIADASLDLIIVHSLAQYLPRTDFTRLIGDLAKKLSSGGRLIISDVLPEGLSPITDAKALIGFGLSGGFLFAAFIGLARTALSEYRQIRSELGLTQYDEIEMLALIDGAGLTARRLEHNPGHNQARMAFAGLKIAPLE